MQTSRFVLLLVLMLLVAALVLLLPISVGAQSPVKTGYICNDGDVFVVTNATQQPLKKGPVSYLEVGAGDSLVLTKDAGGQVIAWLRPASKVSLTPCAGALPTALVALPLPTPAASVASIPREVMWPDGDWVALLSGVAIGIVLVISLFRRR